MPVELGSRYTDQDWSQKLMTLSDFIDDHVLHEVGFYTIQSPNLNPLTRTPHYEKYSLPIGVEGI